jgi:hypothetical protein
MYITENLQVQKAYKGLYEPAGHRKISFRLPGFAYKLSIYTMGCRMNVESFPHDEYSAIPGSAGSCKQPADGKLLNLFLIWHNYYANKPN